MQVINFSEQNTVLNLYLSELRDKKYQQNRLLFRNNIIRIGEMMAYELSKTLDYKVKTVTTPLGTIDTPLPKDDIVVATVPCRTAFPSGVPQCVRPCRQCLCVGLSHVHQP